MAMIKWNQILILGFTGDYWVSSNLKIITSLQEQSQYLWDRILQLWRNSFMSIIVECSCYFKKFFLVRNKFDSIILAEIINISIKLEIICNFIKKKLLNLKTLCTKKECVINTNSSIGQGINKIKGFWCLLKWYITSLRNLTLAGFTTKQNFMIICDWFSFYFLSFPMK